MNATGKCSCPMFSGFVAMPAGECGKAAYGEQTNSPRFWSYAQNRIVREDNKYDGYVPGLACPDHGGPEAPK